MTPLNPLNLSAKEFCKYAGLCCNGEIIKGLRNLGLIRYFRVGKRYKYLTTDAEKINEMLLNNEISIKTDKGKYYITINGSREHIS